MAVTASGDFSLALTNVRDALAASTVVRTWLDAADAAAAKALIFLFEAGLSADGSVISLTEFENQPRFIVLGLGPECRQQRDAVGTYTESSGTNLPVEIELSQDDGELTERDAQLTLLNLAGALADELSAQRLAVRSVAALAPLWRDLDPTQAAVGRRLHSTWVVELGIGS